jgi:GWxTD domain-containing protein
MKFLGLFLITLLFSASLLAQGEKSKLRVLTNTKQFYDPSIGNYLEVQMQFVSYSLNYKEVEGGKQALVEISLIFEQNDKIVKFDKYQINSPIMTDDFVEDFYDIQRFSLNPGEYKLTIEIADLNSAISTEKLSGGMTVTIKDRSKQTTFSEIKELQLIKNTDEENNFTKSGMYLLPKIASKFETSDDKALMYFEIYGGHSADTSLNLRQKLVNSENGEELIEFSKTTSIKNTVVIPVVKQLNIVNLESGKYYVFYELLTNTDSLIAYAGTAIERENFNVVEDALEYENIVLDPAFIKSIPKDSADYYLASLLPIVKSAEQKNILKMLKVKNAEASQKYIQSFWRKTSPTSSYESWLKYKAAVMDVEASFGTTLFSGHATDRGRVFLQYGQATTTILREATPSEYPYEIWQYDKIGKYSNRRFVFYNPDLVNNNYTLLHSDMFGELNNYRWQYILSKRVSSNGNIDSPNGGAGSSYGGNSNGLYKQY